MSNNELAQDQDFKKWVRSNVIHLVNEVAEKFFEEENSYESLYDSTLRSITSQDLDEYLDGDKAPKLGSPEYVELKDSMVEQAYKYYKNRNAFSFLTESEVGTDCF